MSYLICAVCKSNYFMLLFFCCLLCFLQIHLFSCREHFCKLGNKLASDRDQSITAWVLDMFGPKLASIFRNIAADIIRQELSQKLGSAICMSEEDKKLTLFLWWKNELFHLRL